MNGRSPQAHSYQICTCSSSTCGPHIVALDVTGAPICEIVLSPVHTLEFIKQLQSTLYIIATEKDK